MKYIKYKLFAFLLILLAASCSNFEEMNFDPNKPSNVPTSGLLTQAQANLIYNFNGELSQLGAQYVQYFSQIDYVDKSNYADDGISSFLNAYRSGLADLQEIIYLNEKESTKDNVVIYGNNENQIAVANILQTWAFHNMTDIWGDIPYSEALQGDAGIITPKYDTQEAIYDGLIETLNDAVSSINVNPTIQLQGDLIFNGDMNKWVKFANSLKLRIAMRLSEVNSSKADNLINDADFDNVLSDNITFEHLATEAEGNPLYNDNYVYAGGDYFAVASTLIDAMAALNDPRAAVYANPAENTGTIVGLTYGLAVGSNDSDFSLPGDAYGGQTAPSIVMTTAEVLFIKAEAAQRGYISGSAAQYYQEAITASMEYNEIGADAIATYLAQPEVQYDEANWREMIGTQKWIALYNQGIQAWSEWRRLDYPVLSPGPGAAISQIPTRRAYSTDEYSTNIVNVTEAVERMGGSDLFTVKVWWDE